LAEAFASAEVQVQHPDWKMDLQQQRADDLAQGARALRFSKLLVHILGLARRSTFWRLEGRDGLLGLHAMAHQEGRALDLMFLRRAA